MKEKNKKINVLLINDHLGWNQRIMHGVGRLFLQWIPHFDNQRFNISVCILRPEYHFAEAFAERNISVQFLGCGKYNVLALPRILKVIKHDNIDIIHGQGFGATNFVRMARVLTGVPVLIHLHDTNTYYPLVQRLADRMLARFTDRGIAVSHVVKKFWIEGGRLKGLNPERIDVMYNCVDLDDFASPPQVDINHQKAMLGIDHQSKVVGTITRLYETKGNRYLLEAAPIILKKIPNVVFLIVGDGPLKSDLAEQARRLGIEKQVIFTGFRNDVSKVLATFDIKVLSSYAAEGMPLTILEAMAMGKAIVTTDIVEIIKHGETGLCVARKDAKAMAGAIISLLENVSLAEGLGQAAKKASRDFEVNDYVRRLEGIYEEMVAEKDI